MRNTEILKTTKKNKTQKHSSSQMTTFEIEKKLKKIARLGKLDTKRKEKTLKHTNLTLNS